MSDLDSDHFYLQSNQVAESEINAESDEIEYPHYADVQCTSYLYGFLMVSMVK